jgi:peptidoglycan hydrolase-like protein with peptidoglycan-binding domain
MTATIPMRKLRHPNRGAAEQTNIAVQQELAKRGFYQGPIDGSVGPETRKAIAGSRAWRS